MKLKAPVYGSLLIAVIVKVLVLASEDRVALHRLGC